MARNSKPRATDRTLTALQRAHDCLYHVTLTLSVPTLVRLAAWQCADLIRRELIRRGAD